MSLPIIYDIETYPNCFSVTFVQVLTGKTWVYEISDRRNDHKELIEFVHWCKFDGCRWVGFNNVGFDYPVMHRVIDGTNTASEIYNISHRIISTPFDQRFMNIIPEWDRHIPQIDLFMIRHFDNNARATSLKVLEFNMRMDSVEDLPFPPGTSLDASQKDTLINYNLHDIRATELFFWETFPMIQFRDELSAKYSKDFTNFNDTKIGKQFFIMKLEESGVPCFEGRSPRQTVRESINLSDVIFDYIQFDRSEFIRVLQWFKTQTITETKGVFKDVHCIVNGFKFDFGTGGIHGSVESQVIESDDYYIIEDWDVASYYPNLSIANRLYPAHLGEQFCDIYENVYNQRRQYAKGTTENAMLKLALNGVYGDSNSKYSPFYDPAYTMSITINGQLLLCMLAEKLINVDRLSMVQINTDGLTVKYPRTLKSVVHDVCKDWEALTKLTLEHVEYSRMFIRDVNNYIGEYPDGKLKRKGAYEHQLDWHQNHSALVVPKAAEHALVHGGNVRDFIESHDDVFDFMLRTKVPKSSRLVSVDYYGNDTPQQNVTRYVISTLGDDLVKIMPPLKNKIEFRRIGINTGWKVTVCDNADDLDPDYIDHEWYIEEAEKLVRPLL